MKKTIMPTKLEYLGYFYFMGIFKILIITAILTLLSFLSISAALFYTGFREELMGRAVIISSIGCMLAGIILGTFFHHHSLKNGFYQTSEQKIKFYLACNIFYSCILYFIIIIIL